MPTNIRRRLRPNPHVLVLLGFNEHDFMRGILAHAREAGWTLDTNYNRIGLTPSATDAFDGILTVVGKRQELTVLRQYPHVPCVDLSGAWLWDLQAQGARRVARVTYDPAALGRAAAGHLLDQGFRDIVFINTCNGWHERPAQKAIAAETQRRGAGFHEVPLHQAIAAHGPYSATCRTPTVTRWLTRTLCRLPKPCGAILVDEWAPHLLRVCAQADIAVPADIAVMGMFNHRDACEYTAIPVSAVDADFEGIAREGARLLDRLMRGAPIPRRPLLLPPRGIIVRPSTDMLAIRHRETAKAIQFIRQSFRRPISVADVAEAAGLSRRGLSLAFHRETGTSVAHYILRHRVEEAKRLLCETHLKACDIADQTGFGGLEHFSRAFKQKTGLPPAHYRQRHRH